MTEQVYLIGVGAIFAAFTITLAGVALWARSV